MTFPIPAEMPTEVSFIETAESPTAVIRFDGITMAELMDCYDAAFGALHAAIGAGAVTPAGPALGLYHGEPHGRFDLEVGYPLAVPLAEELTFGGFPVRGGRIPAASWAVLGHLGPYDALPASWDRLNAGIAASGRTGSPSWIEVYVSDPMRTPAQELRTDLFAQLDPA